MFEFGMFAIYVILGIIVAWVLLLTYFVVEERLFFRQLGRDLKKGNLIKVLSELVDREKTNAKEISRISEVISDIQTSDLSHIQKIGFVRFNPFEEVGGEHSFSLSLLNGNDSGIVLTGLHTRDRTRVYVKEIKSGSSKIELSKEEKKALDIALRGQNAKS